MQTDTIKNTEKGASAKATAPQEEEFFFAGNGNEFVPMTIKAPSLAEATEIYEKKKVRVETTLAANKEEK